MGLKVSHLQEISIKTGKRQLALILSTLIDSSLL